MNQALQDVIEHRRTANVFEPMRQLADYSALEGRLAPSADAGFMSPEYCWLRLVEQLPITGRKKAGAR